MTDPGHWDNDRLEDVVDAAELLVKTYYGDHDGRAWTVQGSVSRLQRMLFEYSKHRVHLVQQDGKR